MEKLFTLGGRKYWFCLFAAFCAVVAALVGCHDHHHTRVILPVGDIEGYASFPYEDEWGNYPYDTENDLILVTLYDADDIDYEFPLRDYTTGWMGFFQFIDVLPGWYFLTAEVWEYDQVLDITDIYWAETEEDFLVLEGGVHIWDLFLEYSETVPGLPLAASLLKDLSERGAGELEWSPELERYHELRLERFKKGNTQGLPAKSRPKTDTEQLEPAPASN